MKHGSWWTAPWRAQGMAAPSATGWAGFAMPAAVTVSLYAAGAITLTRSGESAAPIAVTALTAVILAPAIEETLTRYLLFRSVEWLAGSWVASAVTALLSAPDTWR